MRGLDGFFEWLNGLRSKEEEVPEIEIDVAPVQPLLYNGKPANQEFYDSSEDENGAELDGFFFYRIKCPTGIILNGVRYPKGAYWFNPVTYEGVETIDAPFQD